MFASVALALPAAALAQGSDATYCKALAAKYREYNKGADPQASVATAAAECDTKASSSIPVLEKALRDDKISLPPRG
jgi:hypothetical protein